MDKPWIHRRGSSGEGWSGRSRSEPVPESELTETFGGYKVTSSYEQWFKGLLQSRIAYWQAEALTRVACAGVSNSAQAGDAAPAQPQKDDEVNVDKTTPTRGRPAKSKLRFPGRAHWLDQRLLERGWSTSDPYQYGGPDRKTVQKIRRGETVRNDVLEKLATALSKTHAKVSVLDIPQD